MVEKLGRKNASPEAAQQQAKIFITKKFYQACNDELTDFSNRNKLGTDGLYAGGVVGGAIGSVAAHDIITGVITGAVVGSVIACIAEGVSIAKQKSNEKRKLERLKESQFDSSGQINPGAPDYPEVYNRAEQLLEQHLKQG